MGTVGVEEANFTIMDGAQCLNLFFYHSNSDSIEFNEEFKKGEKNEKLRFVKKKFLFLRIHELDIVLGVNTDQKNRVRKVCSTKNFFDFWSPVKVRNFGVIDP